MPVRRSSVRLPVPHAPVLDARPSGWVQGNDWEVWLRPCPGLRELALENGSRQFAVLCDNRRRAGMWEAGRRAQPGLGRWAAVWRDLFPLAAGESFPGLGRPSCRLTGSRNSRARSHHAPFAPPCGLRSVQFTAGKRPDSSAEIREERLCGRTLRQLTSPSSASIFNYLLLRAQNVTHLGHSTIMAGNLPE